MYKYFYSNNIIWRCCSIMILQINMCKITNLNVLDNNLTSLSFVSKVNIFIHIEEKKTKIKIYCI